jgi:hypothetical protein
MANTIEDYFLVKEKIKNLDNESISLIFLDLLISKKINYFDITQKYIEFQQINIDVQINTTRVIANDAINVIFSTKKEFKENSTSTIESICKTNMFNSAFLKERLKKKFKL